MKLPLSANNISLAQTKEETIFPPFGFREILKHNDGAGDCYGLYWQLGKEDQEPIVCVASHEEKLLIPEFPNLDSYLNAIETGISAFDIKDTTFFLNLFNRSKVLTRLEKSEEAIEKLLLSTQLFSEFSESWSLLAENYDKIAETEKADVAILNSITANYFFGVPTPKAILRFGDIDAAGPLKDDPLVKVKAELLSGGTYSNPLSVNYDLLSVAIGEFQRINDYKSALAMAQNYGYLMELETKATRTRYTFDSKAWLKSFTQELSETYPNGTIQIS